MRKSRLNRVIQDRLIEQFVAGQTARYAATLVGVNRKTSAYYFQRLREIILYNLEQETSELLHGEIDDSILKGQNKEAKNSLTQGKIPVFGILKSGNKIYTKTISRQNKIRTLRKNNYKIMPDSIYCYDCWRGYNILDVSEFTRYRCKRKKLCFTISSSKNEIDLFWKQTKRHMKKFKGVSKELFPLLLKECEWRFNTPQESLRLTQLKQWVKKDHLV